MSKFLSGYVQSWKHLFQRKKRISLILSIQFAFFHLPGLSNNFFRVQDVVNKQFLIKNASIR